MQATAQGWLVYRLSGQGTSLGLVLACQFLPLLLLGPWAGVLADRMNRRRLTIATQAGMAAQAAPPRRPRPDRAGHAAPRLRPRPRPRRALGHRQPGPPEPRHGARRRGGHPERPLAQHGRHDREPRVRPGARRAARRPDRHRLVLHGQRRVVLRRAGQPPAPEPGAAAHRGAGATGWQAVAGGAALRLAGPGAPLDLRHPDDRLDLRLQLRRLAAAGGVAQPRRRRGRVRAAAGRHQRRQLHGVARSSPRSATSATRRCSARSPSSGSSRP